MELLLRPLRAFPRTSPPCRCPQLVPLAAGVSGASSLPFFVSACNIIYPDVGEGFVEAVSGNFPGRLLVRFVGREVVFDVYRLRFFLRGSLWRRSGSSGVVLS